MCLYDSENVTRFHFVLHPEYRLTSTEYFWVLIVYSFAGCVMLSFVLTWCRNETVCVAVRVCTNWFLSFHVSRSLSLCAWLALHYFHHPRKRQ